MKYEYISPNESEKEKLALSLLANTVFTTMDFKSAEEYREMIHSIFIPIGLGAIDKETAHTMAEINAVLYEYLENAEPITVNNFPVFHSFRVISWADWTEVVQRAQKIKESLVEALAGKLN